MIANKRSKIQQKTGFIWILAIALSIAAHTNIQAAAKPASPSSTQAQASPDPMEWKKVIEAANKEGKLIISGEPSQEWRKVQVDLFQKEYPAIAVEFDGGAGRNFWPRVKQERSFGKKLWDLRSGGSDIQSIEARRDGALAPVRPLLLPEIADDSKWIGGLEGIFLDREKKYVPG